MRYTEVGTRKSVIGNTEQTLFGADGDGKKKLEDPQVGDWLHVGLSIVGISTGGGHAIPRFYAGGTKIFGSELYYPDPGFDLENEAIAHMDLKCQIVAKDDQDLTLRISGDLRWNETVKPFAPASDVIVSTTTVGDAEYLAIDVTNEAAESGHGVYVHRLTIEHVID